MTLVINLGTPYELKFHNDYFLTRETWEEETESLETAKLRLEKDFKIYHITIFTDKTVAYVYQEGEY